MSILIDTSIWINYFRGTGDNEIVDLLIEEDLVVTNDLILTELLPPLHINNQNPIIKLLNEVKKYPIFINWENIKQMQIACLRNGFNGIGIPDLVIAQNATQNHLSLFSSDKHFNLISKLIPLSLYQPN